MQNLALENLPEKLSHHPLERGLFRDAMSRFASGVTIVTTLGPDGAKHGATVSAFSSLSLEPALILVSLSAGSHTLGFIRQSGAFSVNVLNSAQTQMASKFATPSAHKFADIGWTPGASGVPLIDEALASIECHLDSSVVAGDHVIVIGAVTAISVSEGLPLVYFRREYHHLRSLGPKRSGSPQSSHLEVRR